MLWFKSESLRRHICSDWTTQETVFTLTLLQTKDIRRDLFKIFKTIQSFATFYCLLELPPKCRGFAGVELLRPSTPKIMSVFKSKEILFYPQHVFKHLYRLLVCSLYCFVRFQIGFPPFHQPSRLFDWLTATGIITFRVCQMIDCVSELINTWAHVSLRVCVCEKVSKWVREIECDRSGASWHEAVNTFSSAPAGADGVSDKCASVFDLQ